MMSYLAALLTEAATDVASPQSTAKKFVSTTYLGGLAFGKHDQNS